MSIHETSVKLRFCINFDYCLLQTHCTISFKQCLKFWINYFIQGTELTKNSPTMERLCWTLFSSTTYIGTLGM